MAFYESVRDEKTFNVEFFDTEGCTAHFHSAIEMLIIERGSIDININGNYTTLNQGEILVNNSYDIHAYTLNDDSTGNVIIIPKALLNNYFSPNKNRKFESNIIQNRSCFSQLTELYGIMNYYKDSPDNFIINNLGLSAFSIASAYLKLCDYAVENDPMKDILFYLYENYTNPIDLKNTAKKFGYSPNHFSYIFNSYMRINLSSFINNLRVEKSAELIKNGSSIIDASENSGFQSIRTFYRYFKEKYGVSPREYKNNTKVFNP